MQVGGFCKEASGILQVVGWVLTIFKVVIPLLIVALGMFDFGKAVTSAKDEDIKKSAKSLMWRAVAGIIIFFVPSIILWVFGALSAFNEAKNSAGIGFDICKKCVLQPWGCDAKVYDEFST